MGLDIQESAGAAKTHKQHTLLLFFYAEKQFLDVYRTSFL
jgi:hypothetical protein